MSELSLNETESMMVVRSLDILGRLGKMFCPMTQGKVLHVSLICQVSGHRSFMCDVSVNALGFNSYRDFIPKQKVRPIAALLPC